MNYVKKLLHNTDFALNSLDNETSNSKNTEYDNFQIPDELSQELDREFEQHVNQMDKELKILKFTQKDRTMPNTAKDFNTDEIKEPKENEPIDLPKIPIGKFKGMTQNQAISKVIHTNSLLPSSQLNDERNSTRDRIETYENNRRELVAKYEVQKSTFEEAYSLKIGNIETEVRNIREQLNKYIEQCKHQMTELFNTRHLTQMEKVAKLEELDTKFQSELAGLDQLIRANRTMLENLSVSIN